ncbi:hypothetical protein AERO_00430 [Aeromicrobium fastidiosum]|uniref:hypothetical protein n=1 Tax=Aeromicrobium fastidiosum TaxID=52699 RepID=UPI0020233C68|nr:hypothetical protein [Aeromicrobium fastidiosum]MCL8249834.1 hypothetical protein [Aeromicrobium fastidiosum]
MLKVRGRVARRLSTVALVGALAAGLLTAQASSAVAVSTGSIQGTVSSGASGFDASEVLVTAYELEDDEWVEAGYGWSDGDGRYSVDGLAAGDYRLEFYDYSDTTATEYWDDVTDIEDADDVAVGAAQVVTGKDAVLAQALPIGSSREPSVSGALTPGSVLTVDPGAWVPGDVQVFYEWMLNGEEVEGAYDRTFALTAQHVGVPVAVRVTVWKPGYRYETRTLHAGAVGLATPTGLGVAVSPAGATFTWNVVPGATDYRLTMQGRTRTYGGSTGGRTSMTFYAGSLEPGRTYTASVEATASTRPVSSVPATVTFTTPAMPAATKLRTYEKKARSSGVAWPAVEGARRYEITVWSKGRKARTFKTVNRGRVLRGLKPATKHYVRVTSFSADDLSRSVSRKWTFTTRKK